MFKAFYNAVSGNEIAQKYEVEPSPAATGDERSYFLAYFFNTNASEDQLLFPTAAPVLASSLVLVLSPCPPQVQNPKTMCRDP